MAFSIKKHKTALLIGGGVLALLFFSVGARRFVGKEEDIIEKDIGKLPTYQSVEHPHMKGRMGIAHANLGYVNRANPGIDDLDNWVNQTAAGHNAGLDPSEYSYLTQRNRNPLLSNLGYAGHMLTGGPHKNFENLKFQGSWGFVGPPGQGFTTYF